MFESDEDRTDTRRGIVLLAALLIVPIFGAAGALGLALISVMLG